MLAPSLDTAQIRIVLISADQTQISCISNDIKISKIRYLFIVLSKPGELFFNIYSEFKNIRNTIPTVFIFDYKFSSYFIKSMIESLKDIENAAPVDFVIMDAPDDPALRLRLQRLGATLYQSGAEVRSGELTLH